MSVWNFDQADEPDASKEHPACDSLPVVTPPPVETAADLARMFVSDEAFDHEAVHAESYKWQRMGMDLAHRCSMFAQMGPCHGASSLDLMREIAAKAADMAAESSRLLMLLEARGPATD